MTILDNATTEVNLTITSSPERLSTRTIIGRRVTNAWDEDLGTIENLMVNIHTARIEYVILRFEGFFGFGGKLFAIPWRRLSVDQGAGVLLLDRKRRDLELLPGFDKNHWPYTNSHKFKDMDILWDSNTVLQA